MSRTERSRTGTRRPVKSDLNRADLVLDDKMIFDVAEGHDGTLFNWLVIRPVWNES